jgi:3-methyladenine DNA glycosylase AlkD
LKPAAFVKRVRAEFEANRDPANAVTMSKYLLNQFPFLGIVTPRRLELLKPLFAEAKPWADEAFLCEAALQLWALPEREYQHAASVTLFHFRSKLTAVSLPLLRELIQTKSWWDTVDALSTKGVGQLVERYPKLRAEMDAWSEDEDFWVRRCAIIHQLMFKQRTDVERLFAYCAANARDDEFFIRKAIGWALRQYAYTDARAVVEFVEAHPELSNLSKREALKHC